MSHNWHDPSVYLKKIYLAKSCADDSYAKEIIERSGLPVTIVSEEDMGSLVDGDYPENLKEGKKSLLLCRNQGDFLKDCPGTKEYRCCDYQILNVGLGCPMDCVYCILQAYLNNPYLSFFLNVDDLLRELSAKLRSHKGKVFRIGTNDSERLAAALMDAGGPFLIRLGDLEQRLLQVIELGPLTFAFLGLFVAVLGLLFAVGALEFLAQHLAGQALAALGGLAAQGGLEQADQRQG